MKAYFSPKYTVEMGEHVFHTMKFAMTADKLVKDGVLKRFELTEPELAPREDLVLAHNGDYVDRVLQGKLTRRDLELMELPYSKELVRAHRLAVGGTVSACRQALETGLGLHVGGGSHHAMPDHGEGFCMFNDIAIGVLRLLRDHDIRTATVIDLDVHQGNGTAAICAPYPELTTFSMHQQANYPKIKPASTFDIGLADGTGDDEYLSILRAELPHLLERPTDLVVYQAGADVHAEDKLGGLKLSRAGIEERDRTVFEACFKRGLPTAVTLGGGYSAKLQDTVAIHSSTLRIGIESRRSTWTSISAR